jgi:HAD superfamily hydrolase (TIGR01509 family)
VQLLPVQGHLPVERRALTSVSELRPTLAISTITFDFGNTLVRVDRAGLGAIVRQTADALAAAGTIQEVEPFLAVWAEERDRQFREEVPAFREVDLAQRFVRILARLRGMSPDTEPGRWDDDAAERLVDREEIDRAVDVYSRGFVAGIPEMPGVTALLGRLAARGFRLGILSNWPLASTIDAYAESRGWRSVLPNVIVSQRIGTIKPHPAIFRRAAEMLDTPPERILHVGDDWAADVVGGALAGWRTAYLRNGQIDTELPTSAAGDEVEADLVIDALPDIEPRIERWTP